MSDKKEEIRKLGIISNEELKKLKLKHGDVFTLSVLFEEKDTKEVVELFGYLRKPERFETGMSLAIMDSNPIKAKELILEKTWLAGDDRIKTDDDAFYSAILALDGFIEIRMASLKKN